MRLLMLLLFPFTTIAQDSLLTYTEVVELPGQTKEQLFVKARHWFTNTFRDSKEVLEINDKETGELSGKGIIKSRWHYKQFGKREAYPATVFFHISIWVKDSKYKYAITHLEARNKIDNSAASQDFGLLTTSAVSPVKWSGVSQKKMNEVWNDLKIETAKEIEGLIAAMKSSIAAEKSPSDF